MIVSNSNTPPSLQELCAQACEKKFNNELALKANKSSHKGFWKKIQALITSRLYPSNNPAPHWCTSLDTSTIRHIGNPGMMALFEKQYPKTVQKSWFYCYPRFPAAKNQGKTASSWFTAYLNEYLFQKQLKDINRSSVKWQLILENRLKIKSLELQYQNLLSNQELCELVDTFPNIQHLSIPASKNLNLSGWWTTGIDKFKELSKLRSIDLRNDPETINPTDLLKIACMLPQLQHLGIHLSWNKPELSESVIKALRKHTRLKSLSISWTKFFPYNLKEIFYEGTQNGLNQITHFSLKGMINAHNKREVFRFVRTMINNNSSLISIDFSESNFVPCTELWNCFNEDNPLKVLKLAPNSIETLSSQLHKISKLNRLSLSYESPDLAFSYFHSIKEDLPSLKGFHGIPFPIQESIPNHLTTLCLKGSELNAAFFERDQQQLKSIIALELHTLNLSKEALKQIPNYLPKLKYLKLQSFGREFDKDILWDDWKQSFQNMKHLQVLLSNSQSISSKLLRDQVIHAPLLQKAFLMHRDQNEQVTYHVQRKRTGFKIKKRKTPLYKQESLAHYIKNAWNLLLEKIELAANS